MKAEHGYIIYNCISTYLLIIVYWMDVLGALTYI